MKAYEVFSKNMREIREFLGINQRELAKRSGLTPAAISQIESNDRIPSLQSAWKISKALSCNFDRMFLGHDEK